MKILNLFSLCPLCVAAFSAGCSRQDDSPKRMQWATMGTVAAVQCAQPLDAERAQTICTEVFDASEKIFSAWSSSSELSQINSAAGTGKGTALSQEMFTLLQDALAFCRASDGAFNPLIGPVMAEWGFNGAPAPTLAEPSPKALEAASRLADWRQVSTGELPRERFALPRKGMKLDLGAIAKGYAVDLAYAKMKAQGLTNILIDLGGNLRAIGEAAPERGGWRTGVRDPFKQTPFAARFLLRDGEAVASSGNYERFVSIGGVRYAHIMDGRTGRPVTGMAGTTVVAPTAELADALSTTLFVLGEEKGKALLEKYPGCRAFWIPDTPKEPALILSPGWENRLEPFPPFSVKEDAAVRQN